MYIPPKQPLSRPASYLHENTTILPSSTPGPGGKATFAPNQLPGLPNAPSGGIQQIVLDLSQTPPNYPGLLIPPGTGLTYVYSYNTTGTPVSSPLDVVTCQYNLGDGNSQPIDMTPGYVQNNFKQKNTYLTWTPTAYPTRSVFQVTADPIDRPTQTVT